MTAAPEEFKFIPPPEAPVFKPTWEEFQDALGYINKIRPLAEQAGICRIVPPPDWQPPFAVNVEKFKFTPRIQRINELEAHTRIKLNFLDQIAKFWELQGSSLKIPCVEKRALDLYSLHKHVLDEGGADVCNRDRKWNNRVVAKMGYPLGKNIGATLKLHYDRIIHPYDIFNKGKSLPTSSDADPDKKDPEDKDYKPHKIPSRMAGKIPDSEKNGRRSNRYPDNQCDSKIDSDIDEEGKGNGELKRLQFYGIGPKMAGFENEKVEEKGKTRGKKIDYFDYDPLSKYICLNCGRGDAEDQMLLCDGCDDSYHTFCLIPNLPEIPKGDWRCPKCVAVEVSKPLEAFGFEQAQKEYTLQTFGEMADKFKQDYFKMPSHLVPLNTAQEEFWRIVSSIDEDVTVEYGADLHTMDHGSGFPTKSSKNLLGADQEYATSSWNLNNLPVVEGSVLGHINCDISGMKVPWMYVGMCFSTFCWHNEDHWSYSINYLHWGEPKTWYGVPGGQAEAFESAMRGAAGELFDAQPDLLHQLVTIMNPNIIMKKGVSIVRTDQLAGEFVITFPRSYHAGFNQGYNFAEAVNFCPADWLSIGRECVLHYNNLKRYCVFSHDELVCKMATCPDDLDLTVAASTYQDLLKMVDLEKKHRKNVLQSGVTNAVRENFELLQDDERQCDYCKTTCFLSAMSCSCNAEKIVCLRHYKLLCECESTKKSLRYRYTLDELPPMLHGLKVRAESFDNWAEKVKKAIEAPTDDKLEFGDLRSLVDHAENQKFPDSELLQTLIQAVTEAEKCALVATHLSTTKIRTRTRPGADVRARLTLDELKLFYEQVESLACTISEADGVKDLLDQVTNFQTQAQTLIESKDVNSEDLQKQIDLGSVFDIDLPELSLLKRKMDQIEWLEEVEESLEDTETLTRDLVKQLYEDSLQLRPSPEIETTTRQLYDLLANMTLFEKETKNIFSEKISLQKGEELIALAESIPAHLPTAQNIVDAVRKAKEWNSKMKALNQTNASPLLEQVELLINKGKSIPVVLDQFDEFESHVKDAYEWVEKASKIFLKKNSHFTLLEVLVPRADIGVVNVKRKRLRKEELSSQQQICQLLDITPDQLRVPSEMVSAYNNCGVREFRAMRAIRSHNRNKDVHDDLSTFCICQKPAQGNMIVCALCLDQFHTSCVPWSYRNKVKLSSEGRFICSSCERTRRPKLETILSLLVSLTTLPLRVPESEALQNLTERGMSWQDKARKLLQTEEATTALSKLTHLSQKINDGRTHGAPQEFDEGFSTEEEYKDAALKFGEKAEHGYSQNSPLNSEMSAILDSRRPVINLSEEIKQKLTLLLVEGELLEINVDETTHLWRILHASNQTPSQIQSTLINIHKPENKKAKRKSEQNDIVVKSPKRTKLAAKAPKKSVPPNKKPAKRPKQQGKSQASSDSDETVEEKCAAMLCQRPVGSNVQWVQCDWCDLWFHYVCAGLRSLQISEDDEYLCRNCKQKSQTIKTNVTEEESVDLLLSLANTN